jgi:Ca2+-binding RTX toxin-like protein
VSLREAISIAGNGATIAFSSNLNGGAIALTLGELEITKNITINGLGENNLTISGSNESQIFRIAGNAEVNIDGLTITNGFGNTNGGAIDNRGILNLSNTTIRNSFTTADGGGISNLGTLNLLNTTLSNNTAGINGGAITNRGTITATNSIVSTNIALNNGGGIFNLDGTLQLISNTITNNVVNSGNGGGIYSFIGQTTVNNTIIADNFDQGGESPDVNGLFTSNGYNLIGINDGSIGFINGVNGNIVGTRTNPINPLLGNLQNNHVPSIIGPAFDAGDPSLTGSDRLGNPRLQREGVDIGAVEFQFLDTVTVDNLTDEFDGDLSLGDVSLREAIFIAAAGGNVNFAPSLTGGTISLTLGTLNLNRNITIQGLGANNLTVDGNNTFGIFSINNNANTNISGLTLANADNSAIFNNGTLILSDSTVRNSRGRFAGGIENQSNLTVINSKISNNIEEEVDVGDDGDFDAFIGASDGRTRYFENVGTMNSSSFLERSTTTFNNALPDVGNNATPFLADTNGDGFLDAFIGAADGTIHFVNAVVRGGQYPVPVNVGDGTIVLGGFRGVGTEYNAESNRFLVDELHFFGEGLTARNLLLAQKDNDLKVSFEGIANTEVILKSFDLENLDNLSNGIGNILFEGDTSIRNSFDVFDADSKDNRVFKPYTVTFLNELDNNVRGFNNSDDVINGQGGDDKIRGLSGDDLLRGGAGDDLLIGGSGNDILIGGIGNDILQGGSGKNTFRFGADIFQDGLHDRDKIQNFQPGDIFDFSEYIFVGGEISFTRNQRNLIIDLSGEDSIIVRGHLDAAQQQLEVILI